MNSVLAARIQGYGDGSSSLLNGDVTGCLSYLELTGKLGQVAAISLQLLLKWPPAYALYIVSPWYKKPRIINLLVFREGQRWLLSPIDTHARRLESPEISQKEDTRELHLTG